MVKYTTQFIEIAELSDCFVEFDGSFKIRKKT